MWFVLLAAALAIVVIGGLYFRRRLLAALELFAVPRKYRRVISALIVWLLFGFPVLVFAFVFVSFALGRDSVSIELAGIGYSIAPFRYASPASLEVIDLHL